MLESSYEHPNSNMYGVQGVKTFNFQAKVQNGEDTYTFINARPWEISAFIREDGSLNEEAAR